VKAPDPLRAIGELANALQAEAFQDVMSPALERGLREMAVKTREALEEHVGPITPPVLLAFMMGTASQAAVARQRPMETLLGALRAGSAQPDPVLMAAVAFMARDLLESYG
jgi:hypothetical protein